MSVANLFPVGCSLRGAKVENRWGPYYQTDMLLFKWLTRQAISIRWTLSEATGRQAIFSRHRRQASRHILATCT